MTSRRVHIDALEAPDGTVHLLDGQPFTGIAYDLALDGTLAEELSFLEGIQTGAMRQFDRTGRLIDEEHQIGGAAHGLRQRWHATGQIAEREEYEFGILVTGEYWDEQGALTRRFSLDPDDPTWERVQSYRRRFERTPQ